LTKYYLGGSPEYYKFYLQELVKKKIHCAHVALYLGSAIALSMNKIGEQNEIMIIIVLAAFPFPE
jgi:hypothetical protein